MTREIGVVGISRLPKSEMFKQVEEKIEDVRREEVTYFEVEEPRRALRNAMTAWKFTPHSFKRTYRPSWRRRPRGAEVDRRKVEEEGRQGGGGSEDVMNRSTDILEELEVMDDKSGEKIPQWTSEKSGWTLKESFDCTSTRTVQPEGPNT